ncbi:MAG TPA: hypothetical protein VF731_01140 [Solirubrobacterales bacterium]
MTVTMRESWTDERLDDFRSEVNRRFDEVDQRFDKVERELQDLRTDTKAGFERLYRLMLTLGAGALGTLIAASAGLIATQL